MFSGHNVKITLLHYEQIMWQWKELDFSLFTILTHRTKVLSMTLDLNRLVDSSFIFYRSGTIIIENSL